MRVVLVDAKYFAKYIRGARRQLHIHRDDCARMLGVSRRELHKIENGSMLIPENAIQRIIINGMTMLLCKRHK